MDCVLLSLLTICELRVHLDEVNGDKVSCLVHALADEISLAESQTAADGCAGAGCPHGVEGIDVKGQMDGGVVSDVSEGHLDNAADTMSVNVSQAHERRSEKLTGRRRAC